VTLEFSRVTLPPLWTVDEAKAHLHLTGTIDDADVQQKLDSAQEAILSYLNRCADPTWDATTAPKAVTHAVLLLTAYHYYADRGDRPDVANPWPKIYDLLAAYRDPTVA
jgi:hypothetical protein